MPSLNDVVSGKNQIRCTWNGSISNRVRCQDAILFKTRLLINFILFVKISFNYLRAISFFVKVRFVKIWKKKGFFLDVSP